MKKVFEEAHSSWPLHSLHSDNQLATQQIPRQSQSYEQIHRSSLLSLSAQSITAVQGAQENDFYGVNLWGESSCNQVH
jgi:hypothetical protein